jgi:hypothetical protein
VQEPDAQIGAHKCELLAFEGRPVVGVQLVGQPAPLHRLAQAVQKTFKPLLRVKLPVHTDPRAVVDQGEEEGFLPAALRLDRHPVHAVGHP